MFRQPTRFPMHDLIPPGARDLDSLLQTLQQIAPLLDAMPEVAA